MLLVFHDDALLAGVLRGDPKQTRSELLNVSIPHMCKKTFTQTKGTLFYRLRHSEEEVVECMATVGDRNSLAAIHRIKGIKEETVGSWLEKAESQVKQVEEYLVVPHKLSRIQADALWSFVGHKGEKGGSKKKM